MKEIIGKELKKEYNLQLAEWTKDAWCINRESPKKSIELATKALVLSLEIENRRYEAISKFIIGTAQVWISEYELSIKNIHEAKSFFENTPPFSPTDALDNNVIIVESSDATV